MIHEVVAETYTASIETFNLSPTPQTFLRMHNDSICKAIRDGGVKINWQRPQEERKS
jgi:hypothetical protein